MFRIGFLRMQSASFRTSEYYGAKQMSAFTKSLRRFINILGYDIRKLNDLSLRSSISESYALLSRLGFNPNSVIDVGVADGTFDLYSAFPDSYFLLVEPLVDFEPKLKSILSKYRGSYVIAAAGANNGQCIMNVHPLHMQGSSIYKETMGSEADGYQREIQIRRVDDIIGQRKLRGPFLIKVDVQGGELDVLNGCPHALQETEVVVLEASMFEFMKGAPQFHDLIVYMKERGFVTYDIVLG